MAQSSPDILNTSGIRLKKDAFVVIVRTEWNAHVLDILAEGCKQVFEENKVRYQIINVPGAFEISFAIKSYWQNNHDKPDAFVALGCIIKGDTPHFEYVCQAVTQGVVQLNMLLPVPVIFGVLTVNNQAQADERTGGAYGHKGKEAAVAAIKMMALGTSFEK